MKRILVTPRSVTKSGHPSLERFRQAGFEVVFSTPGVQPDEAELLAEVWGAAPDVLTRTVDSHMAELRRKLEPDPAEPRHLLTVWKTGYRFQP